MRRNTAKRSRTPRSSPRFPTEQEICDDDKGDHLNEHRVSHSIQASYDTLYSRFVQGISLYICANDFRVTEGIVEAMDMGPFLRIKSPRFTHKSFSSDWPLWSNKVIADIQEVMGAEQLPLARVAGTLIHQDVVLLGVSGSGKTRTCYDLCRSDRFCVFLDWATHTDLKALRKNLEQLTPPQDFRKSSQLDLFHSNVDLLTMQMFVCRLIVLQIKIKESDITGQEFTPDDFFQLQQLSRNRSQCVFTRVMTELKKLPPQVIMEKCDSLFTWATNLPVCVLMDEVHTLLGLLQGGFHSSTDGSINWKTGKYKSPRGYFSYMASFLRSYRVRTVWSGTHLRIGDISRIVSARAASTDLPLVFQEFNYLTPSMIRKLLDRWTTITDETLKERISNELQGRPRLFMAFICRLAETGKGLTVDEIFKQYTFSVAYDKQNPHSFINFWSNARNLDIRQFVSRDTHIPPQISVLSLLEDILAHSYLVDTSKERQTYLNQALVTTALVMLGPVDGQPGMICEPLVVKAGHRFFKTEMRRDAPADIILNRYLVSTTDEGTRGRSVETLCAIRTREQFWLKKELMEYFPPVLKRLIANGWGDVPPIGLHDCRTGVANHHEKLQSSFLNPNATHIVLTQGRQSAADVVFGYFTFHIKTKWTDVTGNRLVIDDAQSEANGATIKNTWFGDTTMTERQKTNPWFCIRFEFPTNAEMHRQQVTEIIECEGLRTTLTASIDSPFTREFFGEEFVNRVKLLTT